MQLIKPREIPFSDFTTSVAETDAPDWLVGTTYAIGDQVIRDHRVYVSTIDANTGFDPTLENQNLTSKRWLLIGNTNAFKFIDGTIGNKTTSATTVTIDVANVADIDAIMLVGMKASVVQVQAFNSGATEIYNETFSLSGREVYTYYQWFTEPVGETSAKLVVDDLPLAVDNVTLTISGSDIQIGEVIFGDLLNIGTALMTSQTSGEVKHYGRVEFNDYGVLTRIEGPVRNIMRYRVHIPAIAFPRIKSQMDNLAGSLVGAVGSINRPSTVQLGFLGTIKWSEDLPSDYFVTFNVEGTT